MAKPAGPRCNFRCAYCYYLGKAANLPKAPGRMDRGLLELYIAQRLESSPGPVTHFEWHGGEPTLLGLEYFRTIVEIQKRLRPEGRRISNAIQTNGSLIDRGWAGFLARESFSVGLSLDGPARFHNAYRKTSAGGASHHMVMRAWRLLRERGVFCNILCVLASLNAAEPEETYGFFRGIGASYLQFLPLVSADLAGTPSQLAAEPEALGEFLCRVFDLWIKEDLGRIVIQNFDEALKAVHGVPLSLCIHRETCGDVVVLERDGSLYACDHFVDQDHLLGRLGMSPGDLGMSLGGLARDPRLVAFGEAKRGSLPAYCRSCEVLSSCNGGCPKDRFALTPDGEAGLSWLCPAYRRFFTHSRSALTRLSAHIKAGLKPSAFEA